MQNEKITWPGWETVRLIGQGSFGAVYEIQRKLFEDDEPEKAALKVISIPQNDSDIEEMYNDGYDEESVTSTFHAHLKSIVAEYSLMRKMNGSSNIVNCDDVRYVQHDDGIGWDIYIKMELLTPLAKALPAAVSEAQVITIARDMCTALALCSKHNIVHRDIKPQNIFVSAHGDYKLGDFGIAKTVEKTMGGTKTGTYKYMAPEVYNNRPYNSTADIYSLGLVLYWLLNERRMPFMPLPPAKLMAGMDEDARQRRLSGEKLPAPAHGSDELKQIVLKACAYDPKDRYQSAVAMLEDLYSLGSGAAPVVIAPVTEDPIEADEKTTGPAFTGKKNPPAEEDPTEGTVGPVFTPNSAPQQAPVTESPDSAAPQNKETVSKPSILKYILIAVGIMIVVVLLICRCRIFGHNWMDATCTTAETCSFCGATEGIALGHTWKDATCTTAKACSSCGATEGSAPGHSWIEATCTTAKTCSACGATEGTALGHSWVEATLAAPKTCNTCAVTEGERKKITDISAGSWYTMGLISDGTVMITQEDRYRVTNWTDIVAVSTGGNHEIGLKIDGTVVSNGSNNNGEGNVSSWNGITQISAGSAHTLGLRSDGTVVAVGANDWGECNVQNWTDIIAVSAGVQYSVGLKSDGTVVAVGHNESDECEVGSWRNIVAISAGWCTTIGLKADGTVVVAGSGKYKVSGWKDIVAVQAGIYFVAGLKADGTVVLAGQTTRQMNDTEYTISANGWKDIIAISAGYNHLVGLRSDGTVVATGYNADGEVDDILAWNFLIEQS